jgi:CBS domain containing-hemolysin-like protein
VCSSDLHEENSPFSAEEIRQVLHASHLHGELDAHETRWLSQTLDLSDLAVGDLMRPAIDLVTIDVRDGIAENLAEIARHRYSRYPVCDGGRDHLLGLLHVKDLFAAMLEQPQIEDLRPLLRELPMTHRDTPAMKMFRRFKRGYPHLAAVTDDIGSVIGFITFDHILRAAFGDVQDEFRRAREGWRPRGDNVFEGKGSLSIYSLERLLGHELEEENVDSISGLLMQKLDRVPQVGEIVGFEGFSIEVLEMSGPRLELVRLTLFKEEATESEGG